MTAARDQPIEEFLRDPERDLVARRAAVTATARPDVLPLDLFDLRFSDEIYNTLVVLAERPQQACGGVIFDATDRRFV